MRKTINMFTVWNNIRESYFVVQVFAVITSFDQKRSVTEICVLSNI